ncbi:methyltransferase domain-containing protein [Burkholderia multivorans]|nr:methyltransferase domain-containing protein [Burkholderia multivorans]
MHEPNRQYWLRKAGTEYQQQQIRRTGEGNVSYREQEQWLATYLEAMAARLERPVHVLEFGCGFGRFARLFANHHGVRYFGYDFSPTMVEPLYDEPPEGLTPIEDRIRVAPTVVEAFPHAQFDIVFTVSVLIHNPPDVAKQLCHSMASLLTPDGELLLIENGLAPISMRENNWHGGCWVHDFAGTTAADMDVRIYHDWIDNHDIYRLKSPSVPRVVEIANGKSAQPVKATVDELRLIGFERLKQAVALLESEVSERAPTQATAHDLDELHKYLSSDFATLKQAAMDALRVLGDSTPVAESETDATSLGGRLVDAARNAADQLQRLIGAQELRSKITNALIDAQRMEPMLRPPKATSVDVAPALALASSFDWDIDQDTQYTNPCVGFDQVCHVFNREWIGIRAAAGALPGHKLAISAKSELSARDIELAAQNLKANGIEKLIIHGMSEPLYAAVLGLAKAADFEMFLVWHGAPAMWIMEHERKLAGLALDLVKRGIVRRMNGMRLGAEPLIGSAAYPKLLFNMPPKLPPSVIGAWNKADSKLAKGAAFIPSWHLLHKNVATCILAAHVSPDVNEIWVLDADIPSRLGYNDKVTVLGPRHGRAMLETMRQADLVINVSLIDCHPMVELEALAVGTPCVRGPLFLDAHEDHPYVRLTEVRNPLSVSAISDTINQVLRTPPTELTEMMTDYKNSIIKTSVTRYQEFLEI